MIEKGRPWGVPAGGPPDHEVAGTDRALATVVARALGALVRFTPAPGSDLARAVGLERAADGPAAGHTELPMDILVCDGAPDVDVIAVNMVVLGTAPDRVTRLSRRHPVRVTSDGRLLYEGRTTGVVIAVGQWLRGVDLVPRGHPGDGVAEVQCYTLRPGERAAMRRRLAIGEHLPHPRIVTGTAHRVEVAATAPIPVEVDGEAAAPATELVAEVRPGAYRLLV
jgi:hypothetical protein